MVKARILPSRKLKHASIKIYDFKSQMARTAKRLGDSRSEDSTRF